MKFERFMFGLIVWALLISGFTLVGASFLIDTPYGWTKWTLLFLIWLMTVCVTWIWSNDIATRKHYARR